ncbi:MAG: hypothetical protein H7289_02740 [Mucilaginibacter sp.]|nr:hypothetical protein [Mucilaginibacter sp.]
MKNFSLSVALVLCVCLCGSFTNANRANVANGLTTIKHVAPLQSKVAPFCKLTYVDHNGRAVTLVTSSVHATSKNLTFIFDGGERLIISFTIIRPGHFVAESARSRDPQIVFYIGHKAVPMVGAIIISGTKPVSGNFSHLLSDDDDHITLVAGTFSM